MIEPSTSPDNSLVGEKERGPDGYSLNRFWLRLKPMLGEASEIGQHTIAFIAAILSIWLVHLILIFLLGPEAKFYDLIPVRYVIDTGHLAVLVRFVWKLIGQIGR